MLLFNRTSRWVLAPLADRLAERDAFVQPTCWP